MQNKRKDMKQYHKIDIEKLTAKIIIIAVVKMEMKFILLKL